MPIPDDLQRIVNDLLDNFRRALAEMPVETPLALEYRPSVDEPAS